MHKVTGTRIQDIASKERLQTWFRHQKSQGSPVYYILPSRQWLTEARRRQPGLASYTFDDLADAFLRKAGVSFTPLTDGEREAIFLEILRKESTASHKSIEELRHDAKAYSDTYGQLMRLGLQVSELPESLKSLQPVMDVFDRDWVQHHNAFTPEHRILAAVELLKSKPFNTSAVVVDGYFDFSPIQYALLKALVQSGIEISIYVPNFADAEIVQETLRNLSSMGFTVEDALSPRPSQSVQYHVFDATTVEEEIHGVLTTIQSRVTDGIFHAHGLVLTDDNRYLNDLIRIARERNIPVALPTNVNVTDTLVAQVFKETVSMNHHRDAKQKNAILVDAVLRLMFLSPTEYAKTKQAYSVSRVLPEDVALIVASLQSIEESFDDKDTWVGFLSKLIAGIESFALPNRWREIFQDAADTKTLTDVTIEWKAFEGIHRLLQRKHRQLNTSGLGDKVIHRDTVLDWFFRELDKEQVFIERAQVHGVKIHSFRDVGLFHGNYVYVVGMNEGLFPAESPMSGYFQAAHLGEMNIPYGSPTPQTFYNKQKALFEQLAHVADDVTLSYVAGLDAHAPLLPSRLVSEFAPEVQIQHFSQLQRLRDTAEGEYIYHSEFDRIQKLAYHRGLGFDVQVPQQIEEMEENLRRITNGTETIAEQYVDSLLSTEVSVSKLERYAECPFRFGMTSGLKVRDPKREQERVPGNDKGTMFHEMVRMFYGRLGLIGVPFRTFQERDVAGQAESVLRECFDVCWETYVVNKNVSLDSAVLDAAKTDWWNKARTWWRAEREKFWENPKLKDMCILDFEVDITKTFDWEIPVTVVGRLDRVDADDAGFAVYDYKTGSESFNAVDHAKLGTKLQLPLYIQALSEEKPHATPYGGMYISLSKPSTRGGNGMWDENHASKFGLKQKHGKVPSLSAHAMNELVGLENTVRDLWYGTHRDFSVRPYDTATCKYCAWKPVCRVAQTENVEEVSEDAI